MTGTESKQLGDDCLVRECEKEAKHLADDNGLMVSVCEEHYKELEEGDDK